MLVGYARVSTDDQDLTLQRAALKGIGCKRVYEEKGVGCETLSSGAVPDAWPTAGRRRGGRDRLARSTRDLLNIAEQLKEAEAGLRSLHEPWADTTSPAGRMVLTIFAGIAEFERELIRGANRRGARLGKDTWGPVRLSAQAHR